MAATLLYTGATKEAIGAHVQRIKDGLYWDGANFIVGTAAKLIPLAETAAPGGGSYRAVIADPQTAGWNGQFLVEYRRINATGAGLATPGAVVASGILVMTGGDDGPPPPASITIAVNGATVKP